MALEIGVLAFQGDVSEHAAAFIQAGRGTVNVRPVRNPGDLAGLDALAIPGGESTTISRMIERSGLRPHLESFEGGIFATCAGMVVVAAEVDDPHVRPLGMMDITVQRNAFGRQRESFEADIEVMGLKKPFHAVFIRAPVVTRTGPGAQTLASVDDRIVAVRSKRHLALSFHPELGSDYRLHRLFLDMIRES